MKTARPYQRAALNSLWQWINEKETHPLVIAPVGSGKSLMIAEFIRGYNSVHPHTRIVVMAHDKRLLEQNMAELLEQDPLADAGFYCAGLNQKRINNDTTFASIQSIHDKASLMHKRPPSFILIDEAHLVNPVKDTRYRSFIDDCEAMNPNCITIGFTGSPFRSDSGYLYTGNPRLFDGVAYEIAISFMIDEGYLCRPTLPPVTTVMNTEGVGTRGGDFIDKQLDDAVNTDALNRDCVREIIEKGVTRKRGLIFTVTTDHCDNVVEEFRRQGEHAEGIHSKMAKGEVKRIIEDYKAGKIKYLVNVAMLTTGFNCPEIDLLAYMRPTRSPVLYIQCTGRGLRTVYADGYDLETTAGRLAAIANSEKPDCMILDFGGVVEALGPIDDVDISSIKDNKPKGASAEEEEVDELDMKICPKCEAPATKKQRLCYECAHEFYEEEGLALVRGAETKAAILAADRVPEEFNVWGMATSFHRKKTPEGEPPALPVMKVAYETGAGYIYEWVCFEHMGKARNNAIRWHKEHLPAFPNMVPKTVNEALENQCPEKANQRNRYVRPNKISAVKAGKFWNVLSKVMPTLDEINVMVADEEAKEKEIEAQQSAGWIDELIDF